MSDFYPGICQEKGLLQKVYANSDLTLDEINKLKDKQVERMVLVQRATQVYKQYFEYK